MIMQLSSLRLGPGQPLGRLPASPSPAAANSGTPHRLPGAANSRTRDLCGFIVEVKNGFFRVSGKHAEVPAFAGMTGVLAGMTGSLVGMTEILREQMGNK